MNNTAFMDMVVFGFPLDEPSGSTVAEELSHERQSRIYRSAIKGTVETIEQHPATMKFRPQGQPFWPILPGWEEQLKSSSWSGQRQVMELLPKLYIRDLLDSWKCGPEIDGLISRIRQNTVAPNAEVIAQRLNYLWKMSEEEEPDSCVVSSDSLRSFERFSCIYPRMRYPDITLTPGGDVYARWKGADRSLLSIQFLPEMRVRFVVFAPNQRHPEELNRASGNDLVDTVINNLDKAYGVSSWVLE